MIKSSRFASAAMIACGIACVASPAVAQERASVSLEYQLQRVFGDNDGTTMPLGFNADVAGRIMPNLSAFAQVDWSRKSESASGPGITAEATLNLTTFGGGIRWSSTSNTNMTPFAQALVGATHHSASASGSVAGVGGASFSESGTDATFQVGGGIAFPLSGNVTGVGQVDYRRIFIEDDGTNTVRFVFGVRWRLR